MPGDNVYQLVDGLEFASAVPSQFVEGGVSEILLVCQSRYVGCGHVLVTGHNGGNEIGTMVAPVSGSLGTQLFSIDWPAGRAEIPIAILMTPDNHHVGLGIQVTCDSILIGNQMEYWDSETARALYRTEFQPNTIGVFNGSYVYMTMDRAPTTQENGVAQ